MTFEKGDTGKGEENEQRKGKNAGGNKILKPNIRCWHLKQLLLEQENKNKNKMRFDILFPPIKQYIPANGSRIKTYPMQPVSEAREEEERTR